MKSHFKYFSIEELKDQIRNRFASAKQKIVKITPAFTKDSSRMKTDESVVNQKFYNYLRELKSKQRQYESMITQPNQLNSLLKKRRNNINESLQKYQRNTKKCKTISSFKTNKNVCQSQQWQTIVPFASNKTADPTTFHKITNSFNYSQIKKDKILFKDRVNTMASDSNIIADMNLSDKQKKQGDIQKKPDKSCLQSITKVINIAIQNQNLNDKLFSFSKDITSNAKPLLLDLKNHSIKKNIKFQTCPNELQYNSHNYQTQKQCTVYPTQISHESLMSTAQQIALKKIKHRIMISELDMRAYPKQSKGLIKTLQMRFEWQRIKRLQLKANIQSSSKLYYKMRSLQV